jgi:putative membrane protein
MANQAGEPKPVVPGRVETHFAWIRTRLSAERTLEAWVRTGVSLIAFGFAIVEFFDRLKKMPGVDPARDPNLAHYMGLVLIAAGTVASAIAIWQYQILVKYLKSPQFQNISGIENMPRVPTLLVIAVLLCSIGLLTFIAIITRVHLR